MNSVLHASKFVFFVDAKVGDPRAMAYKAEIALDVDSTRDALSAAGDGIH